MKRIMTIFGTRPEAIKMAPVIKELEKNRSIESILVLTGQHKEMVAPILEEFGLNAQFDLEIMSANQSLFDITKKVLEKLDPIIKFQKPDLILVHGDTSSSFAAALSAFYNHIPVGHVEAGLRSGSIYSPFPEEFNRKGISIIADIHFAPTEKARENLLNEGIPDKKIIVTGNSIVDAIKFTVRKDFKHPLITWSKNSKLIILTTHRRENLGQPMINIFKALNRFMERETNCKLIFPIHKNPKIRELANDYIDISDRVKIVEPLHTIEFHNLMSRASLILTDSGGIQEEAPSLGKPVLVMRDTTERPEGIKAGTLKLVGTNEDTIYDNFKLLLENENEYAVMSKSSNPYGDGNACVKIANILEQTLEDK